MYIQSDLHSSVQSNSRLPLFCNGRVIQQGDGNVFSEWESVQIVWTRLNFDFQCQRCRSVPNKFRTSFRWFSRRDQNAWDLSKLCIYKQDNAIWNDFKSYFQDNQVSFFVLFGVFVKIYRYIYLGFPKGNTVVSKQYKISELSSLFLSIQSKTLNNVRAFLWYISLTLYENSKNGCYYLS